MTEPKPDLSRLKIDRDRPPQGVSRALRRSAYIAAAAIVLFVVIFFALRGRGGQTVQVALAELVGGGAGVSTGVTANGYVVARTKASVSSKITGRLEFLGVDEGDVVEAGQVIARLEAEDYAAALAQREADLATARAGLAEAEAERDQLVRDVARAKDLLARGLASNQETEQLEAQLATAEARVERLRATVAAADAGVGVARANLENTEIRAPFSGTILRKDAEVGEVVAPVATGSGLTRGAVVTMADFETLEVEVDVNEAYIARIHHGQPARITLDAYPAVDFPGRVRQIVPTADRQKATVLVKVSFAERDERILPEMSATVEFLEDEGGVPEAAAQPRVFVPAAAVRDEAGRQVVWIVRDDRAERREVVAGPVTGERREIRSGLSGGEQVVVEGSEGLEDGARVKLATER
ncbi:MAG: efflux RND transporter periplasmic adaptor subunit [Gemmatimonadota bacterium]|nr:MAG: efflux RND transporter periplasmic adaptor subunit [Gemmatimonadota bacterium]